MEYCYICYDEATGTGTGTANLYHLCSKQECLVEFERQKQEARERHEYDKLNVKPDTEEKKQYRTDLDALWSGKGKPTGHSPPPMFYGATWKTTAKTTATGFASAATNFLNGSTRFMAFIGAKGRGKTWAAYGVTYAFLAHNFGKDWHSAAFVDWSDFKITAGKCSSNYGPIASDAEQEIGQLAGVGLLVIDEFALTKPFDNQLDHIHKLINTRYKHKRHTLITTTRSLAELEEMMGGGIVDRFSGGKTGGSVVEFNGPNLRQE